MGLCMQNIFPNTCNVWISVLYSAEEQRKRNSIEVASFLASVSGEMLEM